jgi:hypothetical protein
MIEEKCPCHILWFPSNVLDLLEKGTKLEMFTKEALLEHVFSHERVM